MSQRKEPLECVVEIVIAPNSRADRDKLGLTLADLASADPSFQFAIDQESGQVIIKGASEDHLDQNIDRLRRSYSVDLDIGAPQIAYRETISKRVETDYRYKVREAGGGRFVRVKLLCEPDETGGFAVDEAVRCAVPTICIDSVEAGIKSVMVSDVLAGFPLVGVRATLVAVMVDEAHGTPAALEIAARAAFREALRGTTILLEPVMRIEVTAPEDCLGFLKGDLLRRRANLVREHAHGGIAVLEATAPLSSLFGYANQLRSGTRGQGTVTMRFESYQQALDPTGGEPPPAIASAMRA